MRFGLNLPQYEVDFASGRLDLDHVVAYAREAERLGFDAVYVSDHPFAIAPDGTRSEALDPFEVLHAVRDATERITLGTLVLACSRRSPDEIAERAREIGPRFVAGLGLGWYGPEHEELGVPLPPFAERVRRLDACAVAARDAGARVLVGGTAPAVIEVAERRAHAWNMAWDPSPDRFRSFPVRAERSVGLTVLPVRSREAAGEAIESLRSRAPFLEGIDAEALLSSIAWGEGLADRLRAYGADEVIATILLRDDLEMVRDLSRVIAL